MWQPEQPLSHMVATRTLAGAAGAAAAFAAGRVVFFVTFLPMVFFMQKHSPKLPRLRAPRR